jgi:hypothetical protein
VAKIIDNDPKLIAEFLNNAKLRLWEYFNRQDSNIAQLTLLYW